MRDPAVLGIVIGIFEIGCLIGALSCMEIGDRLGRRRTVCVGMFMLVVGISPLLSSGLFQVVFFKLLPSTLVHLLLVVSSLVLDSVSMSLPSQPGNLSVQ